VAGSVVTSRIEVRNDPLRALGIERYVLPWTRYEKLSWTRDFSFRGVLRPILQDNKAKVPRKTIPIFHR
jgi:hypothetical protein